MSEAPLPNSEAARSTTGEILDARDIPPTAAEAAAAARAASEKTATEPTPPTTTTPAATSSTTDPKPADGKPIDPATKPADGTAKSTEPATGAPETYAAFTAPEGQTLDAKAIEVALPVFKELNLTQEQAQKLVNMQAQRDASLLKGPAETYNTMRRNWVAEANADPDMKAYSIKTDNGIKTGLDAVKVDVGRALSALGDEKLANDFRAAMDLTGVGDNPAFIKTFWKLSQFVTEGRHVAGKGPSPHGQTDKGTTSPPTAAQALYPGLPSAARQ